MVRAIWKGLYLKDAALSHIVCDLVNNENDTEKSTNILEYYDTEK